MRVLFRDQFDKKKLVEMNNIPRLGDRVQYGYIPAPRVINVVWLIEGGECDVVVILGQ